VLLIAASATGALVSQGLKQLFGRERPPLALHAVEVVNPSFPSGHAMLSAVVYLTLAVLIARFAERRRVKAYALAAGVALTLLVGASRVFLGVHWPSDVLAGWSLGAAWALAWWLLALAFERRNGGRGAKPSPSSPPAPPPA
jgi:undecaprenyl-diphosphatase